jgi:hypothetical protein
VLAAAWVTAIATSVLALGVPIALATWLGTRHADRRREQRERQQKQQEADERHREHASKISVWMMNDKGPEPYPILGNTSGQPAYRCVVSVYEHQTKRRLGGYPLVDVLPPNETYSMDWAELDPPVDLSRFIPVDVALLFTDRDGVRWEREPDGQLHLVNGPSRHRSEEQAAQPLDSPD